MKKLVEDNDIVVIKADKTDEAPDVNSLLRELGNESAAIPYFAVFRPGQETVQDAINFTGVFKSTDEFIDKIGIENLTGGNSSSDKKATVENVEVQSAANHAPPQGKP
jgi:hypothetical protein